MPFVGWSVHTAGKSADDSGSPRMNEKMALDVLDQIADGGVSKVIFAGYATDPLNCSYIDALLQKAIERDGFWL